MLVFARKALPKTPKRRSRAGCIHCKEKKKKCNENRPECDRCIERGFKCEYDAVKPRKRRRTLFGGYGLSQRNSIDPSVYYNERWREVYKELEVEHRDDHETEHKWDLRSEILFPVDDTSLELEGSTDGDVEEIIREPLDSVSPGSPVHSNSQYSNLVRIAPSPIISPLMEFNVPVYMEFSEKRNRRILVDHFCNTLSPLIVFKEDTGNPFRQLVLPLSHGSSPVINAIYALSSAHLEYKGVENEEKSLDFHNKALQGLAQLIEQNDQVNREEILGAIMLLVYYEVLVQRGNSSIVAGHLKGAMTVMKSGPQISSPTTVFLERAFRFYDVIVALSLGTPPNSSSQPAHAPFPILPTSKDRAAHSPLNAVDTLLGLSTDLWPIIHRLSQLLSFKDSLDAAVAAGQTSKATVLRTELESTAQAIEIALKEWKPHLSLISEDDNQVGTLAERTRIESILNNAEAYRHSAFVFLYREVRNLPRSHPSVQRHAHASLLACSSVVQLAEQCQIGPMSALLWPLFVAACEATTEDDRSMAMEAFVGTERRQGMNNIMRAWEVVQEVWRRADLHEEVNWRHICEERDLKIVLG